MSHGNHLSGWSVSAHPSCPPVDSCNKTPTPGGDPCYVHPMHAGNHSTFPWKGSYSSLARVVLSTSSSSSFHLCLNYESSLCCQEWKGQGLTRCVKHIWTAALLQHNRLDSGSQPQLWPSIWEFLVLGFGYLVCSMWWQMVEVSAQHGGQYYTSNPVERFCPNCNSRICFLAPGF